MKTTTADGMAPARNHGVMNRGAQLEYSEELAPSQTGAQYRQTETMNGTRNATSQADIPGRTQHQSPETSAEHTAMMTAPEPRDIDCRRAFTANDSAQAGRAKRVQHETKR